jgi:hypothetical protein
VPFNAIDFLGRGTEGVMPVTGGEKVRRLSGFGCGVEEVAGGANGDGGVW